MSLLQEGWKAWSNAARLSQEQVGRIERQRMETFRRLIWPGFVPAAKWATPNTVDRLSSTLQLRRFGGDGDPLLVVTPQVNHSFIADFAEDQSLVRTLLADGHAVAVTDWTEPPRDHPYGIADSLDDLLAAVETLGGRAHLVGLCQGGWQATMVAALYPEVANTLTVAAAPIDTHAGSTLLHAFTFGLPPLFFDGMVELGEGAVPGQLIGLGFDNLRAFERYVLNPAAAYLQGDDPAFVERTAALRNWYQLHKGLSGDLYKEVVRELFQENRLARGTFEVRGRRVDLSAIQGELNLLAGKRDHITPVEQVFALERLAPHARVRKHVVDAGHIGVFMGRTALRNVWPGLVGASAEARASS